ncbi:CASP-like protein 2A1 [Musa acuminata AAA Group]|uniref:CASP-like protein n=1 Tax=Musa acuminata subsp. malaccensis TaxID=214687 RepID=A0A804J828_MUSAM|nr:PREDICTED: CASP-like protein 2A1 [Musa acuminata subsp. malaccensis]
MMKTMSEEERKQNKQARGVTAVALGGEEAAASGGADGGDGRAAETLLRVTPVGLCVAALVIMLKNAQDNDYGAISYADLTAFKYLVYANGVCAAYSLFSAFYVAVPRPMTLSRSWTLFFLDQVLTYAILAAGTMSAELMYLAHYGDVKVTWSKECNVFGSFCKRATTSVGITFASVACYVLLSLVSSYRLFSAYETPIPFISSKGLEIASFPH